MEDEFFLKEFRNTVGDDSVAAVLMNRFGSSLLWKWSNRIIKTDLNANIIWEVELLYTSGSSGGPSVNYAIESHTANQIILWGKFYDTSVSRFKLFLAKITQDGVLIWEKYYDIEITGIYSGNADEFIKLYVNNQFVIRAYSNILIIDDDGNIIKNRRQKVSTNNFRQVRGLEVYNGSIYVLYNDSYLGNIVILDGNLDVVFGYRFQSGLEPRNVNAEMRLGRIDNKLIIGFRDVSQNVGLIIYDTNDVNSNDAGNLIVKRFSNNYSYDNYANQLYITNNKIYLIGEKEASSPNLGELVIYRLNENLGVEWIKKTDSFNEVLGFRAFQDFLITTFRTPDSSTTYRVLKSQTDITSACVPFISFADSMVNEDGQWIVSTSVIFEDHVTASLPFSIQINPISSAKINQLCPQTYDVETSIITAAPNTIDADGVSTSLITVQLKDYLGANLSGGGDTVVIATTAGAISSVTDNNDGTYTAVLTASSILETATISFTIDGKLTTNTTQVVFELVVPVVMQSPHLYLQSTGSTGADGSAEGIHLRWLLKKDLIKHLPKGNLATTTSNYNKPDDFVKVYRSPYIETPTVFDLSQTPNAVDNGNAVWVYQQVSGKKCYLYFRDKSKYAVVKGTIDPLTQSVQFLAAYGAELLEFESKNELFFSARFSVSSGTSPAVETELLSVEENTFASQKAITARKTFTGTSQLSSTRMVTENGRSFRFRLTNCEITSITLEFYSDLANAIENGAGWTDLGSFSLSTTDSEVFTRLEPSTNLINGQWQRYNEDAFVNVQNYKDKWNVNNPSTLSNVKQTVQDYISLSDDVANPGALESFAFSDVLPDGVTNQEDDSFQLSNLTLLQQASFDFHMARMLGLGHLDVDSTVQNNDSFVYMAIYETMVSLQNGQLISKDTEHRYISIPTSKADERLPIALDLKEPVPGLFPTNGSSEEIQPLTNLEGYTEDGKTRFISLFAEESADLSIDKGFYQPNIEFSLSENTAPIFAGIEYKGVGETNWRKPELPNTQDYQNAVSSGQNPHNETLPLPIPDDGIALYIHRERETGEHIYGSYGINWFSRAVYSTVEWNIITTIQPTNQLKPPHNRNALLIVEESPLLLTSANEQLLLSNITDSDKTLIRLVFDYNTQQELLTYKVTEENMAGATDPLDANAIFPDDQEVFADEVEIFFRDELPLNCTGKATGIVDHPSNEVLSVISTDVYVLDSTGEIISPSIPTAQLSNFSGGVFVLEEVEYIIHEVSEAPTGPIFTVYKKQLSDRLQTGDAPNVNEELAAPQIFGDGMFLAVENLQNTSSWGVPNPHPQKIQVGDNWNVHRELITREGPDDSLEEIVEKSRGIWDNALIEAVPQAVGFDAGNQPILEHKGLYKATFSSTQLASHPQNTSANPVSWYKGIIRVHTLGDLNGERKDFEVVKIENIGIANNLILHFVDNSFSSEVDYDTIQIGNNVEVNFYPGYRVYLYANVPAGITESTVLPNQGEGIKYTCFGFRSVESNGGYYSKISVPTVMFAQEVVEPLRPELPVGSLYATRPDGFGKATYTITTQFVHKPYGILYYRSDNDAILNGIYNSSTIKVVKQAILDSDASFLANRWQNLLGFDYDYPSNSFQTDGLFAMYPETMEGYRLPNPDNEALFDITGGEVPGSITPGSMIDRIKSVILSVFTPLTEVPLLYDYIKDNTYKPLSKKQVVRDENGALLSPESSDFDIAPMAKITDVNKVQFTDFGLDGTSNNLYFYAVKELGNSMQMGDFSPIFGPIKLVNTNPPIAPGIKSIVPILENKLLGISSKIRIEINAYPEVENIKKIILYRTLDATEALSIRSMQMVKEIDLETIGTLGENSWSIEDDFQDLIEIPFGEPIYYKVNAAREVSYPDKDDNEIILTEYVPSIPSKLIVTSVVENVNPIAPQLSYMGDLSANLEELENVVLIWNKTSFNATYYVYKMNSSGQWVKIHEMLTNESTINLPLNQTSVASNTLPILDTSNNNEAIFHHFKIVVENTSGLLSREENILTIPASV